VPTSLAVLTEEASSCARCKLAGLGRSQVVVGMGDPHAALMFVGEGPGAEEDRQGLPFVGRSGKLLDQLLLEELGITRDRVYITNVVKCRPPDNRDPEADEIASCNPWLERQLDLVDPAVVVTLGKFASQLLLQTKQGITKLRGASYPFGERVLVPTVHPAYVLRGGGEAMAQMRADLVRAKQELAARGATL
jgi:DNA polymerase